MNILFLYNGQIIPEKGGVQRVTQLLADYFSEKGNKVYYLSVKKEENTDDIRQFFLPDSLIISSNLNIDFFRKFAKEKEITLIINQGGTNSELFELIYPNIPNGCKLISVIHCSPLGPILSFSSTYIRQARRLKLGFLLPLTDNRVIKGGLLFLYKKKYQKHYKTLYKNSDLIIVLANSHIKEFEYILGKPDFEKKIHAIANPISIPTSPIKSSFEKELLYVGKINSKEKRVDLLLEIWKEVHEEYADWSLRIVGFGEELDELIELSKSFQLSNIYFEGRQDPFPYYKNASILCMTSGYEGMSMVLLEALAFGVVPIAFNSYSSLPELITDNVTGILVAPFNTKEYAFRLKRLMNNMENIEMLSLNILNKSKEFSLKIIGGKWAAIIDTIPPKK